MWRDVQHALRTIRTKPGFSVPALLSLALGIGANIAIFSVVNGVLIRPLPYPEPQALVGVYNSAVFQAQVMNNMPLSLEMYNAYRERAQTFQEFGVWTEGAATVTGVGEAEQMAALTMTAGVLPALRVQPFLGQRFSDQDDTPGAPETVILSQGYWQRKFGGDEGVIGRMVLIDFIPHRVIGVMPRDFQFLNLAADVLLPQHPPSGPIRGDEFNHSGIARLKRGVTPAQANQDIARVLGIWGHSDGVRQMFEQLRFKPELRPLKQDVVGDTGAVLNCADGRARISVAAGVRERSEPGACEGTGAASGVCNTRGSWRCLGKDRARVTGGESYVGNTRRGDGSRSWHTQDCGYSSQAG